MGLGSGSAVETLATDNGYIQLACQTGPTALSCSACSSGHGAVKPHDQHRQPRWVQASPPAGETAYLVVKGVDGIHD